MALTQLTKRLAIKLDGDQTLNSLLFDVDSNELTMAFDGSTSECTCAVSDARAIAGRFPGMVQIIDARDEKAWLRADTIIRIEEDEDGECLVHTEDDEWRSEKSLADLMRLIDRAPTPEKGNGKKRAPKPTTDDPFAVPES